MNESAKRAHKNLTISQKIKILERSYKILPENYGLGVSTICDIEKKVL